MTQLTGTGPQVVAQSIFSSSAEQMHVLGELVHTSDGRAFRYAKAGGTTLVQGKLQQASAEVTANQDLAAIAAAVGDTTISASTTVTITANQYAGGYALITVTPGQGYMYRIKSHAAYTAAAPTLTLEDPIVLTALTTGSRIDLVAHPLASVIVNPASASSAPVGVCVYPITNAQFGWLQVAGVANILNDGGSTVGTNVSASNATAGAVEAAVTAQAAIGVAVTGVATTEYGAVKLFGLL